MCDYINVVKIKAIKPCSPTPKHLRIVKLSMLDQLMLDIYIPLVLFFPNNVIDQQIQNPIKIASDRVRLLRETLSKVLSLYYPFAGRLRNNVFVECNDEGVEFVEAIATVTISEILRNRSKVSLNDFVAAQLDETIQESHGGRLLLVQATIFECGGIALGLSFSHKFSDACTIVEFIKSWAKIATHENPELVGLAKPEFGQACDLFPPIEVPESSFSSDELNQTKGVTRRFVFTAEKITALKSISSSNDNQNPTRVEVVSALLWKCAMKARASRPNNSTRSLSLCHVIMNIRKRIKPPFEDNVVGNLLSGFFLKTDHRDQEGLGLQVIVDKLRRGIKEVTESYSNKENVLTSILGQYQELGCAMKSDETEYYLISSWCRFGLYEADFGWEKPTWVTIAGTSICKNFVFLMDTKDGDGIEAWLSLNEEDMAFIETDQEFLDFALNPSVV